jgi:hypothetical protein
MEWGTRSSDKPKIGVSTFSTMKNMKKTWGSILQPTAEVDQAFVEISDLKQKNRP